MVAYNNSLPDGATALLDRDHRVGRDLPGRRRRQHPRRPGRRLRADRPESTYRTPITGYLNLFRDPLNPFVSDATLFVTNIERFQNRGFGATWRPFDVEVQTDVHRISRSSTR